MNIFKSKLKDYGKILLVLLAALSLRLYGIKWDNGFHLHPDERMLIMVTDRIHFFKNLNPDFFNYGSLPVYLLRLFSPGGNYDSLLITGRLLSVFFDLITILLIYKIALLIFSSIRIDKQRFKAEKLALISSFLYSVAFFPIQNAHFFVVDVFLTAFTTMLLYLLLIFSNKPSLKKISLIGIVFAAMLATKITPLIFYPVILGVIIFAVFRRISLESIKKTFFFLLIFHSVFFAFHFLFMPYAYLDNKKFFNDISLQMEMNSNPYIFPYTLQYVGTFPYFYYLKNIFLWGLGPVISLLTITGVILIGKNTFFNSVISLKSGLKKYKLFLVSAVFYLFYFLVVGRSAVKFMRYMLPLYPFLVILAGYGLNRISGFSRLLAISVTIAVIGWCFMFMNIYSHPHTRISATEWIIKNVPKGSTITVEHWDDMLPLYGGDFFRFEQMTLYDLPDDVSKWNILKERLKKTDYLIVASNRLYIPLQKLSDCEKFRVCYPLTAKYYQDLFNNRLHFRKVAEFSVSPIFINDQSADESFTVYDHPKILIFKKI